jgi:hypothetical protein
MMIQAGLLQVHGNSDIGHGGAMKSLLPEYLGRRIENVVSGHEFSLPNGR